MGEGRLNDGRRFDVAYLGDSRWLKGRPMYSDPHNECCAVERVARSGG
jgi:hypothetical protein